MHLPYAQGARWEAPGDAGGARTHHGFFLVLCERLFRWVGPAPGPRPLYPRSRRGRAPCSAFARPLVRRSYSWRTRARASGVISPFPFHAYLGRAAGALAHIAAPVPGSVHIAHICPQFASASGSQIARIGWLGARLGSQRAACGSGVCVFGLGLRLAGRSTAWLVGWSAGRGEELGGRTGRKDASGTLDGIWEAEAGDRRAGSERRRMIVMGWMDG